MAVPLTQVEEAGEAASALVVPLPCLLTWMPKVVVSAAGADRTRHGNELRPADCVGAAAGEGARVRVFDESGALLALAERTASGLLHPDIVVV
jgi:tRNA U55 pseudouridine synthase TruB